jgi:uncharacterized protein (DUF433 family)
MNTVLDRVTIDDELCNGKPTIRGLRITVQTILEFLLAGTSEEDILYQYPALEKEDLQACKQFAVQLMEKKYSIKDIAA